MIESSRRTSAGPTGIPQWLEQFLNSQGGMQGLLYQVGGMQGLLAMIQEQSQQPSQPRQPRNPDPFGWAEWQQANPSTRAPASRPGMPYQAPTGTAPYGSLGGNPVQFAPGTSGNPNNALITLPEGAAPLQALPWVNQMNTAPYAVNPFLAGGTHGTGTPQLKDPYGLGQAKQSSTPGYSQYLSQADIDKIKSAPPNLKGYDLAKYLQGTALGPSASTAELESLSQAQMKAGAAFHANPSDPYLKQQYILANDAMMTAGQGPYWAMLNSGMPMSSWDGVGSNWKPEVTGPQTKAEYATQYGYKAPGGYADAANILQTLKGAGWDRSKGFGPQAEWDPLSSGAARPAAQQKMLNDLLYSISPRDNGPAPWAKTPSTEPKLPEAPDPFAGMQSAINRDAYVNDTLGGGFYGGLIPEQDAKNTFGGRFIGGAHDPHFATPQLKLNPLPGESMYDTYAGWAADQGAAFGTAPWAVDSQYGQAQGFDDPRRYQQPPAPGTAFQPTPQFGQGGVNTFAGTQGWGNTSRNGQQNAFGGTSSTQQQPMTFGASPWNNPWGMR